MSLRLFAFFLLFLVAVMSGVLIILLISGVFQTGINESHTLLKNELTHISQDVYLDYGKISVHSVALGQKLSESLEKQFKKHGFAADELQDHPELLTDFLDQEMVTLTNDLEKTKSSAAFLILDATVNPAIDGAESLRAGLYIKNMEPNIVNSSFSNLRFLRGPMVVAKNHGIQILPNGKWISGSEYGVLQQNHGYCQKQ